MLCFLNKMRYLVFLFIFGFARQIISTSEQYQTNFDYIERRLVRLEARQIVDAESLEQRVIRLENRQKTYYVEKTINLDDVNSKSKKLSLERILDQIDKLENNLKKELSNRITKLLSTYDVLFEKISIIEKLVASNARDTKSKKFDEITISESKKLEEITIGESKKLEEITIGESEKFEEVKVPQSKKLEEIKVPENLEEINESNKLDETKVAESKLSDKPKVVFNKIGEKYYYIENDIFLDWYAARNRCRSLNASLVNIQNEQEWAMLTEELLPSFNYWSLFLFGCVKVDVFENAMQQYVLILFFFGMALQTSLAGVLRIESSQLSDEAKIEQDRLVSLLGSNVTEEALSAKDQSLHSIPLDLPSTSEELREVESSQLPDVSKIEQDRLVSLLQSNGTDETLDANDESLHLISFDLPSSSASDNIKVLKEIQINWKKLKNNTLATPYIQAKTIPRSQKHHHIISNT
ncbi:uncharacterized protein [Drosophila takahashii]|uniref:uncharacterized protein n=1 Tax=Drosophila takahashii TaxID=29030 RepID=UPI003898E17F